MVTNSAGKLVEKPRYGGVFVGALFAPLEGFDEAFTRPWMAFINRLTNEELLIGDWAKGPQGTGEAGFQIRGTTFLNLEAGSVAESWEIVDDSTIIYNIRKGIYWHDKPPVNGRELTANDVAFSLNRVFTTPTAFMSISYGRIFESATATDKWTVVVKSIPGNIGIIIHRTADYVQIHPPEVIEKYGSMREWQNVIGTGPFMMEDYVPGSSVRVVRNPNYWGTDPLHPDNQLPYLDGVRWLIIQDLSTRLAALRTAKIDWLHAIGWEDHATLQKTNPELQDFRYLRAAHADVIFMRSDTPPFDDIRVRRAMNMAVNQQAIKDEYYGGNAELLSTPVAPYTEFLEMYTPLEEHSQIVQENYGYYPEKARQLLAEAGYPDGFKTELVLWSQQADVAQILVDYWAKIGVDVKLNVKEYGTYRSIAAARSHPAMIYSVVASVAPYVATFMDPKHLQNASMIDDPKLNEILVLLKENIVVNDDVVRKALGDVYPYVLDNTWWVETPSPYLFTQWQPWVKGYAGEVTVGVGNYYIFPKWIWYDQDLKESLTGKR